MLDDTLLTIFFVWESILEALLASTKALHIVTLHLLDTFEVLKGLWLEI